jgi:hypothetical protein
VTQHLYKFFSQIPKKEKKTLCNFAKDKLCDNFMIFWNKNKQDILNGNNSKIDTYFSLKKCFDREKYTEINDFKIHYSLCKLRISAHVNFDYIYKHHIIIHS